MLKAENEKDKERFDKMKSTEMKHGRDEEAAIHVAANETKELREREGRARHETSPAGSGALDGDD